MHFGNFSVFSIKVCISPSKKTNVGDGSSQVPS